MTWHLIRDIKRNERTVVQVAKGMEVKGSFIIENLVDEVLWAKVADFMKELQTNADEPDTRIN